MVKKLIVGQADVISIVILTSIIIILAISVLNYAVFSLEKAAQQAEFEKVKNILREMAFYTVDSVINGINYEISFPTRTTRLNFITSKYKLRLEIYGLSKKPIERIVDDEIIEVICLGGEFVSPYEEVIVGLRGRVAFINDIYTTPLVVVNYNEFFGRTAVSLNFSRLLIQDYKFSNNMILDLTYIDISWTSKGEVSLGKISIIYIGSSNDVIYEEYVKKPIKVMLRLYLDSKLLDETVIEVNGKTYFTIRLVTHKVQYILR